jgi:hypothetical protein
MEIQDDLAYRSDTPGSERNNLSLKMEPEATVSVPAVPGLSFYAHGVLEQVADAAPYEDRYFKDEGFYIQDLYASYDVGRFGFRGGKMNPGFGLAWDQAAGVYGTDMAEDYELSERIALTANAGIEPEGWGTHVLTVGTFFLDTSPLQNTIYSKSRGTLERSDGGASNTGDFSSFNILLDGEFPTTPKVVYHLGYVRQAHGTDGTTDETGVAAALSTKFDMGHGVALTPLVEVVHLNDVGGTPNKDRQYVTLSTLTEWRTWNLALAYTGRETTETGASTMDDYQLQASVGYAFESGLTADLGWKRLKEDHAFTDTIGVLFTYNFGYSR